MVPCDFREPQNPTSNSRASLAASHRVGPCLARPSLELGRLYDWRQEFWSRLYSAVPVSEESAALIAHLKYIFSNSVKEQLVELIP